MRWHAHARRVATTSHPLSSSPPRQRRTDKRPPCGLHVRPLPLRHRCYTLLRARAILSLCRHTELWGGSLPPCACPRCPHAMHGYKRKPLPLVCPCPHRCLPPVSHPGRASPLFSTTSSVPSHLTHLSPRTQVPKLHQSPKLLPNLKGPAPSPPLSSGAIDCTGEFRPSVARLPRCELGLSIVLGEYTVGWESLRCISC
jgi:hypothetical protein